MQKTMISESPANRDFLRVSSLVVSMNPLELWKGWVELAASVLQKSVEIAFFGWLANWLELDTSARAGLFAGDVWLGEKPALRFSVSVDYSSEVETVLLVEGLRCVDGEASGWVPLGSIGLGLVPSVYVGFLLRNPVEKDELFRCAAIAVGLPSEGELARAWFDASFVRSSRLMAPAESAFDPEMDFEIGLHILGKLSGL